MHSRHWVFAFVVWWLQVQLQYEMLGEERKGLKMVFGNNGVNNWERGYNTGVKRNCDNNEGTFSMCRSWEYIIVTSRTVILTPRTSQLPLMCKTKLFVTFNTEKKKGKNTFPTPNHSATRHCWRLRCTTLPLTHLPTLQYNNTRRKERHYMM